MKFTHRFLFLTNWTNFIMV